MSNISITKITYSTLETTENYNRWKIV